MRLVPWLHGLKLRLSRRTGSTLRRRRLRFNFAPFAAEVLEVRTLLSAVTTATLTSSTNPSPATDRVFFTATVASAAGSPTGTVEYLEDGASLGTATLIAGVSQVGGISLTPGNHQITALYDGDGNFAPTSVTLTQTVNKVDQTIVFRSLADGSSIGVPFMDGSYDGVPITFWATTSTGLPVSMAVLSGPATLSAPDINALRTLTVTGTGTVVIEASQPGNDIFNAAVTDYSFTANLTTAGRLDPTFGSGGEQIINFDGVVTDLNSSLANSIDFVNIFPSDVIFNPMPILTGVAVQPDGVIDLVGNFGGSGQPLGLGPAAALSPNGGIISAGLGASDVTFLPPPTAVQADGKTIVVSGVGQEFLVQRYDIDGSLDTSFGNVGTATVAFGSGSYAAIPTTVAVQPDGKIVVAGYNFHFPSPTSSDFVVARLDGFAPTAVGTPGDDNIAVSPGTQAGTLKVDVNGVITDNLPSAATMLVDGGGGNDTFTVTAAPAASLILVGQGLADSYDVSFGSLAGPVVVTDNGTSGTGQLTVHGTPGDDYIFKDATHVTLGNPVQETILYSGIASLTIHGGAGNDTIVDPGSNTQIFGDAGNDTIIINATGAAGVFVDGGAGSDTYVIGGGNLAGPVTIADSGTSGTDNIKIVGTSGNDTLAQTASGFVLDGTPINVTGVIAATFQGLFQLTGDYALSPSAQLAVGLGGTAPGNQPNQYGQLDVSGNVTLAGALSLTLTNGFVPVEGNTFTIIRNDGSKPVAGTFAGLAEGAVLAAAGRQFRISYAGGDGNDVTLTDVTLVDTTPATTVNAMEGSSTGSVVLATFTDANPAATAADFTSTVNWGGALLGAATASVQFVSQSGATTTWEVVGSAIYAEKGSNAVTVVVHDDDGGSFTTTKTAINMADAPLTDTTVTTNLTATPGTSIGTVVLATFADADPLAPLSDFTPTVNWGGPLIGTPTAAVQLLSRSAAASTWQVVGSATYAAEGAYTVSVTVHDVDGNSVSTSKTSFNVPDDVRVLLLDPSGSGALSDSGNGTITIGGTGVIAVASTNSTAIVVSGNGKVTASELDLKSATGTQVTGNGKVTGTIAHGVAAFEVADPLAGLAVPTSPATQFSAVNASGNAVVTLQPGTYVGGIKASGNAKVTLVAGAYFVKGGGFSVAGNAIVTGSGVFLYNAPQTSSDLVSISGNGSVVLTAPTTGAYQGVVIFQERNSAVPISIAGNGGLKLTGTLYAAGAAVNLSGNGMLTFQGTAGRLISADLSDTGNGTLTANTSSAGSSTKALTAADGAGDSSNSGTSLGTVGSLGLGVLTVAVDGLSGDSAADAEARIEDAIASLDAELAPFGVKLVEVAGDLADAANIHVHVADTSAIGGVADGVLGVTVGGNDITLIAGWNWFTGTDPLTIAAGQYDFQTVATHELGHATGLGHSTDNGSVMYHTLASGDIRHDLTAADMTVLESAGNGQPEPLLAAAPATSVPSAAEAPALGEATIHNEPSVESQLRETSTAAGQSVSVVPSALIQTPSSLIGFVFGAFGSVDSNQLPVVGILRAEVKFVDSAGGSLPSGAAQPASIEGQDDTAVLLTPRVQFESELSKIAELRSDQTALLSDGTADSPTSSLENGSLLSGTTMNKSARGA